MTVVDVAGVAIALDASDDARRHVLLQALAGFTDAHAPSVASIAIDGRYEAAPDAAPDAEEREYRFWTNRAGVVVASRSAVLRVGEDAAAIHVRDDEDLDVVEGMVAVALAWLLARHARYLVHGAAVARDGIGFLVLGESRAGKSTFAAAALEAGWAVLSDDLVVLAPDAGGICMHGVHREPAIPMELGGPVVEQATPMDGPRGRASLDRGVLTSGTVDLAGTIVVSHSAEAGGTFDPTGGRRLVPLLMKSFPPTVDAALRPEFFAFTERVIGLPAWELGHARDVAQRRAHVARALSQCAT